MLNQVGSDLRRRCRNRKGFHIILPYTVDNDFLQSTLPKPQDDFIMELQGLIQALTSLSLLAPSRSMCYHGSRKEVELYGFKNLSV